MHREKLTYQCQATGRQVMLTRQTFYEASGIGDQAPIMQRDHGCSQEHVCLHRYTDACKVQRMNR